MKIKAGIDGLAKAMMEKKIILEDWSVGDTVHLGLAVKGGAGFDGKITKIDGDTVEIKNKEGKTYKGPVKNLSKG